jgi:hypothetical protein
MAALPGADLTKADPNRPGAGKSGRPDYPMFGKHWPVEQAARIVRSPQTGEQVQLPDRTVIKFKMRESTDGAGSEEEAPSQATA